MYSMSATSSATLNRNFKRVVTQPAMNEWMNEWLVNDSSGTDVADWNDSAVLCPSVQLHLLQTGGPLRGAEPPAAVARRHQALLQVSLRPEGHRTGPAAAQALHVRKRSMLLSLSFIILLRRRRVILPVNKCVSRNCGLFKWERDGMLKVKHPNNKSVSFEWKETNLMLFFFFFNFRRKQDRRLEESFSCLVERSTASSSTASDTSWRDS